MPRTDLRTAKIRELRNKLNQARAFILATGAWSLKGQKVSVESCVAILDETGEKEFPRGGTKNC